MTIRRALLGCALVFSVACSRDKGQESVTGDEAAAKGAPLVIARSDVPGPAPVRKIRVRASIEGMGDMISFVEDVTAKLEPDQAVDIRGELQADLLQSGFGPGFFESLDLDRMFAIDLGYPFPEPGQAPPRTSDWTVAGVIPTHDARRLLDSMPDTNKPQPLGNGLWELIDGDFRLKLREKDRSIEFGGEIADLDRASQLPAEIGKGRRIRARVSDLPREWLDLEQVLGPMPGQGPRRILDVLREMTAIEFAGELGSDRDAVALVAAEAPFAQLGLEPVGAPVTGSSEIASMLPPGAAGVVSLAWGKPKLLHQAIDDNVDPSQVPAPFDAVVADAVRAVHELLDLLTDETLLALYVDDKGRATVVMAGAVRDEAGAREAIRTLLGAAEKAFSAHIALQGGEKDKKYSVSIKKNLSVSRAKTDRFTVTVPKFLATDVTPLAMFFGKKNPRLEAYTLVDEGVAMLAFGAGAKQTMSDIGRSLGKKRTKSLEMDGGLALARALDGGCQLCAGIDPVAATRAYFVFKRDGGENPKANPALAKLRKIRLQGQMAVAATLATDRASVGVAFPRRLIEANPKGTRDLNALIDEVRAADPTVDVWGALGESGATP